MDLAEFFGFSWRFCTLLADKESMLEEAAASSDPTGADASGAASTPISDSSEEEADAAADSDDPAELEAASDGA